MRTSVTKVKNRNAFPCATQCALWLRFCLTLLGMFALVSCSSGTNAQPKVSPEPQPLARTTAAAPPEAAPAGNAPADTAPTDNAPLPHIDAKRAFQYTREVTVFGERYMGNENHKKLERYIVDHLRTTT